MLVDVNYKFIYLDVGANGAGSDSGVFNGTNSKKRLEINTLGLPGHKPLVHDRQLKQYFLIGDGAFPLKTYDEALATESNEG